ncbi:CoA-disulfide reductase [Oceanispirochaeta crateris]|uniref:CoA-disulfide reductase n=1 Tax=Oceanispirochaeta crateris TaxID=2518645 RepID=A0A5C1QFE2_9SPIO|nr:FAD-dependent oxidoreductase [Oceanispirochaeta crateris]QEN06755.1 CoA-disulfide reductase [Oceanispirochaeta crateris]
MDKLLIIGGVAAGATAAARARRMNQDIDITILEAGPDVSFANCGLPYYIGGDIKSRSKLILQSPESFKDQYNVTVETMTEALSIDKNNKTVSTINHETGEKKDFSYDKLILSQGGKPFIPGLAGGDKSHVFSLWTLEDMDHIHTFIEEKKPETAVVVGGGFIGLEMVEALRKRDIKVSVVEMAPHVMAMMEGETAGFLQKEMEAWRIGVHTGRSVTSIEDHSVTLDNNETLNADLVLLSVGVKPTLQLAEAAGLTIGEAGGLAVNEYLETSDKNILAGGDMVEVVHTVSGHKLRIPLAGPANRQGRIAANNALAVDPSDRMKYKGAQGTSIVRIFDAVAGITGMNLKQALQAGFNAEAVAVRKDHHVSYYPGGTPVAIHLVYDKDSAQILGAQVYGENGVDKRLDVLSTAITAGMKVQDLGELDLSYAPPFGSANDPVNMAGFAAENRLTGYSPSLTAAELEPFVDGKKLALIDIRDYFTFQKGHIQGAVNLAPEKVLEELAQVARGVTILIVDEDGKTAHRVVRQLRLAGYEDSLFISGGYPGLEFFGRSGGFQFLQIPMKAPDEKSLLKNQEDPSSLEAEHDSKGTAPLDKTTALVVDVRTPMEFAGGAYPDAVNIPLDELPRRVSELGQTDREITVYCATGARSGYAARILTQQGFSNVTNGGGLMQMMAG